MYTNIMYKFTSSSCKTVGEKLQTKLRPGQTDGQTDRQTDRRTAMAILFTPPLHFLVGVIIIALMVLPKDNPSKIMQHFNSLPNDKILDRSEFKALQTTKQM